MKRKNTTPPPPPQIIIWGTTKKYKNSPRCPRTPKSHLEIAHAEPGVLRPSRQGVGHHLQLPGRAGEHDGQTPTAEEAEVFLVAHVRGVSKEQPRHLMGKGRRKEQQQ